MLRRSGRLAAQIPQGSQTPERMAAEQVAPVTVLLPAPDDDPHHHATQKPQRHEASGVNGAVAVAVPWPDDYPPPLPPRPGHRISRRADSACAIVTPSAYSRSPPTGMPRAMRETVSG